MLSGRAANELDEPEEERLLLKESVGPAGRGDGPAEHITRASRF